MTVPQGHGEFTAEAHRLRSGGLCPAAAGERHRGLHAPKQIPGPFGQDPTACWGTLVSCTAAVGGEFWKCWGGFNRYDRIGWIDTADRIG